MQHSTVVPVWLCLYLELKLWNLESGCQGATLTHSSKSVNLEHSEAVCAQATGPVSRVLVLLESCVAKAVAGDAGGVDHLSHRSSVPVGVQSQRSDCSTLGLVVVCNMYSFQQC